MNKYSNSDSRMEMFFGVVQAGIALGCEGVMSSLEAEGCKTISGNERVLAKI